MSRPIEFNYVEQQNTFVVIKARYILNSISFSLPNVNAYRMETELTLKDITDASETRFTIFLLGGSELSFTLRKVLAEKLHDILRQFMSY